MEVSKELFKQLVWEKINLLNADITDAILTVSEKLNIELETAGRIIASDKVLKEMLKIEATKNKSLKKEVIKIDE